MLFGVLTYLSIQIPQNTVNKKKWLSKVYKLYLSPDRCRCFSYLNRAIFLSPRRCIYWTILNIIVCIWSSNVIRWMNTTSSTVVVSINKAPVFKLYSVQWLFSVEYRLSFDSMLSETVISRGRWTSWYGLEISASNIKRSVR